MLLSNQNHVSPFRGLPVDDKGSASSITTVTGETVQLFYISGVTLTQDAGEVAGTMVVGQLAFNNIKNALGNMEAIKGDTSLSFSAGALTTEVAVDFTQIEILDATGIANKITEIGKILTANGQYCVDYASGTIYGRKTTTASTLTSTTYKYQSNPTTTIIPGTGATNLGKAEDAATASGDTGVAILSRRRDTPQASAGTEGDYQFIDTSGNGGVWTELASLISGENQTNLLMHTGPKFVNSSTAKPTSTTNLSFTTATISSNPVLLVGARIVNTAASARYLFLNNATSIAGAAAPSVAPVLIPASGAYNLTPEELGKLGEMFTTALTIGNSTTAATFTAGSAGDLLVTVYWTTATS